MCSTNTLDYMINVKQKKIYCKYWNKEQYNENNNIKF